MALELATAYIRIKVHRESLRGQLTATRGEIQRGLGTLKVTVRIIPKLDPRAMSVLKAQLAQLGTVTGGGKGGGAGGVNMSGPASIMSGASRVATGKSLFGGAIGGFAKGSFQIAAGILGAQAALGTLAIPVRAIQSAAEFEQAMVRVQAVTNATADQMQRLTKQALDLSKSTKFTASEVGNALVTLGQKGLSATQIQKASPTVLNFAAAGRVSPEQAADTLVGIMNAMQIGTQDLGRAADVLTRTALRSSADVQSVGEAFKYVGPLAELAGQDIEQVSAALALLANVNLGGSIGGTGFKRIIGDLLNPEKLDKINKRFGKVFDFRKSNGDLKNLADIVDEINDAFGENAVGADKAAFALEIFGQRAGPQFAALLQKGGDELRRLEAIMHDTSITAKGVAEKEMDTLTGSFLKLKSAIESLMISVVGPFSDSLKAIADHLTQVSNAISDLHDEFRRFDPPDWMKEIGKSIQEIKDLAVEGLGAVGGGPAAIGKSENMPLVKINKAVMGLGSSETEASRKDKARREAEGMAARLRHRKDERLMQENKNIKNRIAFFTGESVAGISDEALKAAGIPEGRIKSARVKESIGEKMGMARIGFGRRLGQLQGVQKDLGIPELTEVIARFGMTVSPTFAAAAAAGGGTLKKPEEKKSEFTPRFLAIEEMSKQIQMQISKPKDVKIAEKNEKNTNSAATSLMNIDQKLKNLKSIIIQGN